MILVLVLLVVVIIVTGVMQKRTIKRKERYLNPLYGTMPHEVNIEEVRITFHSNGFSGFADTSLIVYKINWPFHV